MSSSTFILIYLVYGLAFFSMGLAITLEVHRSVDDRLRLALRALALFGFLHGIHEWIEIFEQLGLWPLQGADPTTWQTMRVALLEFSFLLLAAFGAALLPRVKDFRRASLAVPLALATVWGIGLVVLRGYFTIETGLWAVADVWTRYSVAIPAALLACIGLISQYRIYRARKMPQFGQASLIAAVAFIWYGLVGQIFVRSSGLPPSTVINQELFARLFGFPIELLRAGAAVMSAYAVIRVLRSFEAETRREIARLQADRLHEAQRRETLRGELLDRVVTAQETERQRIARELHDETGQALTAIGLGLRGASTTLRLDIDKAAANLRQLEGLVVHSLDELERLIADLRPSHLDDLGLPSALRWYVNEVQHRVPLKIGVEITGEPYSIEPQANTALFRMAQEALTNVVKHANATSAKVCLCYEPTAVHLRVEDDGQGFDVAQIRSGDRLTWGLTGVEERTALLGGQCQIVSQPGAGTRIEVTVPYRHSLESKDDHAPIIS